ncbi:hydantoinase/oxoprolinase family protein [Paracidovorax cattleyae]|uniref:N-methylhydantoinase A n=1 Tax=Paracidovorax cattleyae TaxID=80868 RepID=A0A1H0LK67_9BURK|nr:hydantoinase/oxoprolinase family protein [Paracidovorax cattleyae]SDO68436.1 N-methylhydantoinase A [Paracidovorax cattleyae]
MSLPSPVSASSSPRAAATGTRLRLAVDVGGTFTDIVLLRGDARFTAKVLTTPGAPELAVLGGIDEVLQQAALGWADVDLLILGTTLATNALIERKGARTALITTEGFRDLVEIGLEDRFAQYDVFLEKPAPLVPRHWRHGVKERVDAAGQVLTPLEEAQVIALAGQLQADGIESVAVCFLHGYANPVHERRVRELLLAHAPGLWVSLASDVCPEIREYERLSTISANAYVQPQVAGYLSRLHEGAKARGLRGEPFLMTSGGAITTLQTGIDEPVRLVESGPAGGAVLARQVAEQIGASRALSFDMGGTTAKICFIDDYQPQVSRSFEFGRVHRHLKGSGLPIRIPVIEMVEIGAGGGSIARVNHLGVVQVGPDSAGSSPGPAAYGLGGEQPTVTDAHAALGTVDPARFAVGKVRLEPQRARDALVQGLTAQTGLEVEAAAQAVIDIVTENMANAARVHASELGKSADESTLIAFGGAAPLHAALLARKLGIARLVVPGSAGVGSALGFLWAPVAYQTVRSLHQRILQADHAAVEALLAELTAHADDVVLRAAPGARLARQRTVYMRYAGQGHEIPVDLPEGPFDAAAARALHARFEARYAALYGRSLPHIATEAVSWSVAVEAGGRAAPEPDAVPADVGPAIPHGTRRVYDADAAAWRDIAVYERTGLQPGQWLAGPALVVEDETTTYVIAGFELRISRLGALVLTDTAALAAQVQADAESAVAA